MHREADITYNGVNFPASPPEPGQTGVGGKTPCLGALYCEFVIARVETEKSSNDDLPLCVYEA